MHFPNEEQSKRIQKHLLNFSNLLKNNKNPEFYDIQVSEFFEGHNGGVFIIQKDDGFWWYSRFRNPKKE